MGGGDSIGGAQNLRGTRIEQWTAAMQVVSEGHCSSGQWGGAVCATLEEVGRKERGRWPEADAWKQDCVTVE